MEMLRGHIVWSAPELAVARVYLSVSDDMWNRLVEKRSRNFRYANPPLQSDATAGIITWLFCIARSRVMADLLISEAPNYYVQIIFLSLCYNASVQIWVCY